MNNQYKMTLTSPSLYKEIELSKDITQIGIGTTSNCEIRLPREQFFGPVSLYLRNDGREWTLVCSDEIYLSAGDSRKYMNMKLRHGHKLQVRYQNTDAFIFDLEFLIDFDDGQVKYDRFIQIQGMPVIRIGGSGQNQIMLKSPYAAKEAVELTKRNDGYLIKILSTAYGVDVNGHKTSSGTMLRPGDFLTIGDYFFFYDKGDLYGQIRNDISYQGISCSDIKEKGTYPKFSRSSRIQTGINDEKIEILDPSAVPQKPKNNVFMRLLPSVGMLMASGVMAYFGGAMIIMSAVSGGMAIVTTVLGIRETKKDYETAVKKRIDTYNQYISRKRNEIQDCRNQELQEMETIYISQNTEKNRFLRFSTKLFDRAPEDTDFLVVRLGNGPIESHRPVNYKKKEKLEPDDELQAIPEQIANESKYLANAPVTLDLKDLNAIGIVGEFKLRYEMMKNLILDTAARQFFGDLNMFFIAEPRHAKYIEWLRFMPFVYNKDLKIRTLVTDDESRNIIFEYLYKELSSRKEGKRKLPHLLIFFLDEYGIHTHPISRFISEAKDLGVTFIFFGSHISRIPQGCGSIITLLDGSHGEVVSTKSVNDLVRFEYPRVSDQDMKKIVELLAPVYTEEISLEGTLTKNISLFELLGIYSVDDIPLRENWKHSKVYKSMSAPLGVSKTGVVTLDLHDKADGPHGLVAGTTGSGKSEILQTYILAMSALFHPYEVSFVIIDFKGGGMVNQFKDLPHLRGAITNIDGKAINRSLKSIRAELAKRQRRFKEVNVNHIDKYIQKFQAGEAKEPLPHLIIIVDEFAELKAEQPDFMKELISAARIGRSLGVHLILATQKPSGQVDDQIWSNSRFKLCLKVQSASDSNEVLKSPLAAEIKEPGRAYLQVGNNEKFELFQSAYSGASEKMDSGNEKEFTVYQLTSAARRVPIYTRKKKEGSQRSKTQLEAMVDYIHSEFGKMNQRQLDDICLPALAKSIPFQCNPYSNTKETMMVEVGMFDDPDNQIQDVFEVDLSRSNMMIIGSSNSGKTNLLQTMIRSLTEKFTPEEVNIYILDFASRFLKNFEKLAHVGGVVTSSEDEKLKNLFKLLYGAIEERKEKLISKGVSSFTAYREAGGKDLPLIVLMIDNLTALKELYFNDDDQLLTLCREGLSVGISIVIANSQTNGIGYKYLSNFSSRIALFCNDSSEYGNLFEHCRETVENMPGRALVEINKEHLDAQTYLSFEGEKEIDRAMAIERFVRQINADNPGMAANRIPIIPASLTRAYVEEELFMTMRGQHDVVAGLDYASVSPFVMDFSSIGLLGISGKEQSGKHNWLKSMVHTMNNLHPDQTKVYIADSFSKKLADLKKCPNTEKYTLLADEALQYVSEIETELEKRYQQIAMGNDNALDDVPMLLLIINSQDIAETISSNMSAMTSLKNIINRYKKMKAAVIVAAENQLINYSSPEIYKILRDTPHFMFFDDLSAMKLVDLPLTLVRSFKKPIELGDGYYIRESQVVKLKTALDVGPVRNEVQGDLS